MFKRGSKSITAGVAEAITEGLRYSSGGNTVVLVKGGTILGIRLEPTPQPVPTGYGDLPVTAYGPADSLAHVVGDVLRHVTGTPQPETDPESTEGTDEVRYVPVDDAASDDPEPTRVLKAERRYAQRDLLTVVQEQVQVWRDTGCATVSHTGLKGFLDALERKIEAGEHVQPSPF